MTKRKQEAGKADPERPLFIREGPGGSNKGSSELHAERREAVYELYIRRMPTTDIAAKVGLDRSTVSGMVKEQQKINREASQDRGNSIDEMVQDYLDSLDAAIFKGWQVLENPLLALSSQNVGTVLGHIAAMEERKAKALGLLVDRSKIEADVNAKLNILDLVQAARSHDD